MRDPEPAPRPSPLSGHSVAGRVHEAQAATTAYRIYRWQWLIRYSAYPRGDGTGDVRRDAEGYFAAFFAGRVHPHHVRYDEQDGVCWLVIHQPALLGEFRTRAQAQAWSTEQALSDAIIVARDGPAERELRDYGMRLLPETRT